MPFIPGKKGAFTKKGAAPAAPMTPMKAIEPLAPSDGAESESELLTCPECGATFTAEEAMDEGPMPAGDDDTANRY